MKRLEEAKQKIEIQFRSIESASRNQETDIKLFYSKLSAKVKERELEVLSSMEKQFEGLNKQLKTAQSEVEEQFSSTKLLLKKIDEISTVVSPYALLSRLEL